MFNRYESADHRSYTNITQQPNDAADAARLYGEVKQKAETDIAEAVRLVSNKFNAVAHVAELCMSESKMFKIIFDLNGHRIVVEHEEPKDYISSPQDARQIMIDNLIKKVSERIAGEILFEAFKPLLNNRQI